jgi:hypothetical protein
LISLFKVFLTAVCGAPLGSGKRGSREVIARKGSENMGIGEVLRMDRDNEGDRNRKGG